MAPADRHPNRRASPMPATDTHTTPEDVERTRVERTALPTEEYEVRPSDQLTRRLDVSSQSQKSASPERAMPRRVDPRPTDIYTESPDVLGAPERTVVTPLPPRHVDVEPVPDAATTNGARVAAEVEERRARRARDEAQREEARREAQRRDDLRRAEQKRDNTRRGRPEARETDQDLAIEPPRNPAKEKTSPAISVREAERQHSKRRRDATSEDEPVVLGQELTHSPTRIERAPADTPWTRLGVALRDVAASLSAGTREGWRTLRYEGVRPFIDKAKPHVARGWGRMRELAARLRIAAVTKATEMGLVKPKRLNHFEQEGDDMLDESRVDAWRRFNKSKTSSSYLQDDE